MKHTKILPLLVVLAGMLTLLVGCEKDKLLQYSEFTFNANVEKPDGDAKVHLVNEEWVFWEPGDRISIMGDKGAGPGETIGTAYLASDASGDFSDYKGVFHTSLIQGSQYFLGLFPENTGNTITPRSGSDFDATICLNSTQEYRSDITFGRNVMPMVAWYGGTWEASPYTPFNLDFHLLGGIVRLQIVNESSTDVTLDRIDITSRDDKMLAGKFIVDGYKTNQPYLRDDGEATNKVTLACGEGGVELPINGIASFYLVLPALGTNSVNTEYLLTMDAVTNTGTHCTKNFSVKVRRKGITYMRALGVSEWNTTTGSAEGRLVGNGTAERPFKIYTLEDLQYLRDCYNSSAPRRINGQEITSNTEIRLMRSDIELTNSNWTSGISHFVGHWSSNENGSNPGIKSTSNTPLFASVDAGGVVEGISLKCNINYTSTTSTWSPFCNSNNGTLKNCVLKPLTVDGVDGKVRTEETNLAGICVNNNGTLKGCRCEANMEVMNGNGLAGICYVNGGTIDECHVASPMTVSQPGGGNVAGICMENVASGRITKCYCGINITSSSSNWAGIAFENHGTVERCYLSHTGSIITTGTVGGIVNENKSDGTIDYCHSEPALEGNQVGAIARSSEGAIINCYVNYASAMITLLSTSADNVAGGLVGNMTGGSIKNSYVNGITMYRGSTADPIGGIVGEISGGTIDNCYSYEGHHIFYGSKSGGTLTSGTCWLVAGTQEGVSTITYANAILSSGNESLIVKLNAQRESIPGARYWLNSGTLPYLATDAK